MKFPPLEKKMSQIGLVADLQTDAQVCIVIFITDILSYIMQCETSSCKQYLF